jgi:hypothetical protein
VKLIHRPNLPQREFEELLWCRIFDELLPIWVKSKYLPDARVASKPFGPNDVRFFGRSVEELSERFTTDREDLGDYFSHPKYRSAYALYWIPLQAAKVWTLLMQPSSPFQKQKTGGTLRILDLGAGPGTASLATLVAAASLTTPPSKIQIHLLDRSIPALNDGVDWVTSAAEALDLNVEVKMHAVDLKRLDTQRLPDVDFVICANTLNELSASHKLEPILERFSDCALGTLWIEPAAKEPSQQLSALRALALSDFSQHVVSPCLHQEACPLASGRNWCHWSVGGKLPGYWFHQFSRILGSERQWLKFSHMWLKGQDTRSVSPSVSPSKKTTAAPEGFRVVTDPMEGSILLCQPGEALRSRVQDRGPNTPRRGDWVDSAVPWISEHPEGKIKIRTRR